MVRLEANLEAKDLADQLVAGWQAMRQASNQGSSHVVMALGGRKDSVGSPGAPLQQGDWGVDVVETSDADVFLKSIQWDALVSGRPADGIFKVMNG